MILATIQPSFLPWLGYLEQMALVDLFVYLDDVKFTKQDWRNRNRILNSAGQSEYITVPVRAGSDRLPIRDVRIADETRWRRKLCDKLVACYGRAPHADRYLSQVVNIIKRNHQQLVDLNYDMIEFLRSAYAIETPTVLSSDAAQLDADKNQRLIDICLHYGADTLYDGAAARCFIDIDRFRAAGIRVVFQSYVPASYQQGEHAFVSHLSALDALVWCGEDAREVLRGSPVPQELAKRP